MLHMDTFSGKKQTLIDDNEAKYSTEIRAQYGDATIDRSNAKVTSMTQEQYTVVERLSQQVHETLKAAFEQGDPANELAQQTYALHRDWLCYFWDHYSPEAHIAVTQMYVDDPCFTAYYDAIAPGCAQFLRDAVRIGVNT